MLLIRELLQPREVAPEGRALLPAPPPFFLLPLNLPLYPALNGLVESMASKEDMDLLVLKLLRVSGLNRTHWSIIKHSKLSFHNQGSGLLPSLAMGMCPGHLGLEHHLALPPSGLQKLQQLFRSQSHPGVRLIPNCHFSLVP